MSDRETEEKFTALLNVMAQLRSDAGCPWTSRRLTSRSSLACSKTYELLDALDVIASLFTSPEPRTVLNAGKVTQKYWQ